MPAHFSISRSLRTSKVEEKITELIFFNTKARASYGQRHRRLPTNNNKEKNAPLVPASRVNSFPLLKSRNLYMYGPGTTCNRKMPDVLRIVPCQRLGLVPTVEWLGG
jgi:hypothetical protein